ncbi:hypothetical protein CAEBREN_12761 [Caenorhabditis brenneri]|uniref:Uncharacterized protein n=1 Tax=Caenorhabditis brenneri TaxID=135651 RepID=G0MNF1_CAEBE|nr:hypothetical protein CAEBREN_12761 [Caenorhabditis brenneri]
MEIRGLEFATIVFHWFSIQLLSVLLIFCAKKKATKANVHSPSTTQGATVATTTGETQKTTSGQVTPGNGNTPNKQTDDDDDDVAFNINIKKPEEKKDEFDDDEENPLAKIAVKPRNKNAPGKKATGPAGKVAEKANARAAKTKEENLERAFLAPNEKQYGVSCYQFEPSQPNVPVSHQVAALPAPPPSAPAPSAPLKKAQMQNQMQKSGDGGRAMTRTIATAPTAPAPVAPTPIPASTTLPNVEAVNTKSTISLPNTKKTTKTVEQERTSHDNALEKTQKCEGEAAK